MPDKAKESGVLRFLYHNAFGRILLRLLIARWVSKLCGAFLSSRLSKPLIGRFVRNNGIDLNEFEADNFRCFNDCFCRKIKEGGRPIPQDEQVLFSPCDGLLSAYRIQADTVLPVKQSAYTVASLLQDETLAKQYHDGTCLVFRLCVNHYHRYCYPTNGVKGENVFIKGKLHTVRPIALEARPVFVENCREYTVLHTENFGDVTQIEVGALMVGRIVNNYKSGKFPRGAEKGRFEFGGSTIVVLLEKDRAVLDAELFENTAADKETIVRCGEKIGSKI